MNLRHITGRTLNFKATLIALAPGLRAGGHEMATTLKSSFSETGRSQNGGALLAPLAPFFTGVPWHRSSLKPIALLIIIFF